MCEAPPAQLGVDFPLHPRPITPTGQHFPLPQPQTLTCSPGGSWRLQEAQSHHLHLFSFIQLYSTRCNTESARGRETVLGAVPTSHTHTWVTQDLLPLGHSRTIPSHSISGLGKLE